MKKINDFVERFHWLLLVVAFVLAFSFRIIGIAWGMPHGDLHPDEGIIYAEAYSNAINHNFEVKTYYRPNHVTIKLSTLLYLGIQEVYFAPQGLQDFAVNYSEHFALFTVASRVFTLLFGMGTVIFAYLIARNFGKREALLLTFLFAVFPSFIEHSHYITPDIPLLFFLMGVLWAALCYYKEPSLKWIIWMSFFTALGTCEKYPGIYGCVIIAVTVIVTQKKNIKKIITEGFLAILFVFLGIMAVSPILIVDWKNVLETMAGQNSQYHLGGDGLNFGETLIFYSTTSAVHVGLIFTLLGLYGLWKVIRRDIRKTLIVLSLFAYIIPISALSVHWERYTHPIYFVGLLFGTIGAISVLDDFQDVLCKKKIFSYAAIFVIILLPFGSLFAGSLAMAGRFLAPDSRILLQEQLASQGINVNNTVYDCNTPLDPGGYYGAFSNFDDADPAQYKYGSTPRYVMTSSAERDLFLESDQEVYQSVARFYRKLDSDYNLVFLYSVENPESYFIEIKNIIKSLKTVNAYLHGAATGYEIRVYQMVP